MYWTGGWIPERKKPWRITELHGYSAGCGKCQRWSHWWENSWKCAKPESGGKPGNY